MTSVISEYQKWKEQGKELRAHAKQAMEARFRDLMAEAVQLAEEYRADFGATLKPPPLVTSFRYKANSKPKAKAPARKAGAKPEPVAPPPTSPEQEKKIAGLQKRLATARKKLEDAKAAGAPTKNLEDRVYEIDDELRLATQPK